MFDPLSHVCPNRREQKALVMQMPHPDAKLAVTHQKWRGYSVGCTSNQTTENTCETRKYKYSSLSDQWADSSQYLMPGTTD